MLKAKDKEARRGNLITFAIVLALTLVTMVLENVMSPGSLLFTVIKKGAVYSLVAVSMNLLNGFTGLFSLGQAGFMLLGAYAYAIFMIPDAARDGVYYLFEGSSIHFSFQEMFQHLFGATGFGGGVSLVLGVLVAIIFAGLIAAFFAYLIGLPVLRLKSDYLAIATLGFAEILRAIFQWQTLGKVTNGANILKGYPTFADFNITNASGKVLFRLSAVVPILLAGICIFLIVLLINSSYGRAFKAIRDDEIAAEAMGVNLAKHKSLSFVISSFFAGVSGALFAMFATTVQAKVFTSAMTYEILLIVVIQGAIWINFSFPYFMGTNLYFMGYLIVSSIQMGANIDYAIVIATRFNELKDKMEHKQAMIETINFAFPTILTSGTIMTVSGILIGQMTSDACIVGIGQCLGRGTIISIILVLFVLPQILLIGTRIVDRTSFAVPKLVARSSGNGRMRVNGIVQGEIHGSVAGTMNAIVDGDVQLTVISGNVSQELDDNKQQEVQNEDQ